MQVTYNCGKYAVTTVSSVPRIGETVVMSGDMGELTDTWKVVDVIRRLNLPCPPGAFTEFVEVMLSPVYNSVNYGADHWVSNTTSDISE